MRQAHGELTISTRGRGFTEITAALSKWLTAQGAREGVLTVFIKHTSASLVVQENADPSVRRDLETFFAALVPDGDPRFTHDAEGPDDMPAHVRAALTQTSLTVPVRGGAMTLGTWQAVYLYEHRHAGHSRSLALHFIGE